MDGGRVGGGRVGEGGREEGNGMPIYRVQLHPFCSLG